MLGPVVGRKTVRFRLWFQVASLMMLAIMTDNREASPVGWVLGFMHYIILFSYCPFTEEESNI